MTEEDDEIRKVDLPILFGGSLHLYTSGRVVLTTSEDWSEFGDEHIAAVADLLAEARLIRGSAR